MSEEIPTPSLANNRPAITQNHTGSGDNIGRDKIVHSVTPGVIRRSIQDILTGVREKQIDDAIQIFEQLCNTASLDHQSKSILDVIEVLIAIANSDVPTNAYSRVSNAKDNLCDDPFSLDIALSAQLRLDDELDRQSEAHKRFLNGGGYGHYSREAYLECIANELEISELCLTGVENLQENELCGLVRGALKAKLWEESRIAATRLDTIYRTRNSQVLLLFTKFYSFIAEVNNRHYFAFSVQLRATAIVLCGELQVQVEKSEGCDLRLLHIVHSMLHVAIHDFESLINICLTYRSAIEKRHSLLGEKLRLLSTSSHDSGEDIGSKLSKALENTSFRTREISSLVSSQEISIEESFFLSRTADSHQIDSWISNGGVVAGDSPFESDFSLLELKAAACGEDPASRDIVRKATQAFVQKYIAELPEFNCLRALGFSNILRQLDLGDAAVEFLAPQIPQSDFWPSPLVVSYLESLLLSQQLATLGDKLGSVPKELWTTQLWIIRARQQVALVDFEAAIYSLEQALQIEPLAVEIWEIYLFIARRSGEKFATCRSVAERIPEDVFSQISQAGYRISAELTRIGLFSRVERHLISWFIESPDKNAVQFTNVYFSSLVDHQSVGLIQESPSTPECLGGVRYLSDGREHLKILVPDNVSAHPGVLNSSSLLGNALAGMEIGETRGIGMAEVQLLERLPPYRAVLSIAMDIRQALNDGSDSFHAFHISNDPDELYETLTKKLQVGVDENNSVNENPNIPLCFKGYRYAKDSPVKGALYALTSDKVVGFGLAPIGVESPKDAILDIYAILFFALSGLDRLLLKMVPNLIVTAETMRLIEDWLAEINRDDYLTIGLNEAGGLVRNTAEDIRRDTKRLQTAILNITASAQVILPNVVDMPPEILMLDDAVDESVLSSQKLSIANDIALLTVDPILANVANNSGYQIANAYHMVSELLRTATIEEKLPTLHLAAFSRIGVPFTFTDYILLSQSKDEAALCILSQLQRTHAEGFSSLGENAIPLLANIAVNVLVNAYADSVKLMGEWDNCSRRGYYTHRVFNACAYIAMHSLSVGSCEKRYASYLYKVLLRLLPIPDLLGISQYLGSLFAVGHFLDIDAVNVELKILVDAQ